MQRTLAALALALLSSCRPPVVPMVEVLAANADIAAGAPIEPGAVRHVLVPAAQSAGLLRPADEASLQSLRPRIALQTGDRLRPELFQPATTPAYITVPTRGRRYTVPMSGAESLRAGDHIDVLLYTTDQATHEGMAMTLLQNVGVLGAGAVTGSTRPVSLALTLEEGQIVTVSAHLGTMQATLRNPDDKTLQEERGRATLQTVLFSERGNTLLKRRMEQEAKRPARPMPPEPEPVAATSPRPTPRPVAPEAATGPLAPTIEILDR